MAAKGGKVYTRDEVLKEILDNVDNLDDQDEEENSEIDEEDSQKVKLEEVLSAFDFGKAFDHHFFRENAMDVLLPVFRLSFPIENTLEKDVKLKAAIRLSTSKLSIGSVLDEESRRWLKAIYRRLVGKVHSRNPYRGEITRSIPYGVFSTARQVLRDIGAHEPDCYIASNRKGEVISITSLRLVLDFFSLLSGMDVKEVKKYFRRTLTTQSRYQHKVKVIVSEVKDFSFVYKKRSGLFSVQFNYGEWNAFGNPQHSTRFL